MALTATWPVQCMSMDISAVCQVPEMRDKVVASTPQAFSAAYKDTLIWEKLVKVSGAKLD